MGHTIQNMLKSIRRTVIAVAALGVLATGAAVVESSLPTSAAADPAPAGWGAEALVESGHSGGFSLIGVANACGLGASSCFKCHNGSRADKPNMDPNAAPWHVEHEKVNHSCVGCHDGNPRIIREAMAHRNLVANPNQAPERCASCHADDTDTLLQRYLTVASGE